MHLSEEFDGSCEPSVSRVGFWGQFTEVSSRLRAADIFVYLLIIGFGVLQFVYAERAADFYHDDVFYADAVHSLVEHGFYGINGYPETNQPPGLPWILGLLCMAGGSCHAAFLRTMAVFGTLGFLAT